MRDKTVVEKDGVRIIVKVFDDYDMPLDWLGEYKSKQPYEWFVDRKTGKVYGEQYEEFVTVDYEEYECRQYMLQPKPIFYRYQMPKGYSLWRGDIGFNEIANRDVWIWIPELDGITDEVEQDRLAWEKITAHRAAGGKLMIVQRDDSIYLHPDLQDVEDNEDGTYTVQLSGNRVIGDIYTYYERNDYQYIELGSNHIPPGHGWDHVPQETRDKVIAEFGSLEAYDIKSAIEDAQRLENFGHTWWCIGIDVSLEDIATGYELASAGLWGIETDSKKDYYEEIVTDLIKECYANIDASRISEHALILGERAVGKIPSVEEMREEVLEAIDL